MFGTFLSRLYDVSVKSAAVGSTIALIGGKWAAQAPALYLSGNISNNTNPAAWEDITGLTFPVVANGVYYVRGVLLTVGSSIGNMSLYGVNGPASPALLTVSVSRALVTAGTGHQATVATAYDTGTTITSANTSGSLPVYIDIWFVNGSTAGTLAIRHKNTTAGAAITTNAGSFIVPVRIA